MKSGLKRLGINLAVLSAGCLLALVAAEVAVRAFFPQPHYNFPKDYFVRDETLGWRAAPNSRGVYMHTNEYHVRIETNSLGFRDREIEPVKPPGQVRVVGLGDSYAFGHGVSVDDSYLGVLEETLNRSGVRARVIKAGVVGYSPEQCLLLLKRELMAYKPDVVILGVYIGNDILDSAYTVEELKEIYWGRPRSIRAWLHDNLKLYTFVADRVKNSPFLKGWLMRLGLVSGGEISAAWYNLYRVPFSERVKKGFHRLKSVILEARRLVGEAKGTVVVLAVSDFIQFDKKLWARAKRSLGLKEENFDLSIPNEELKSFCRENGIPFFDTLPILAKAYDSGEELYFPQDTHWRPAAHRLVGRGLAAFLMARGLKGVAFAAVPGRIVAPAREPLSDKGESP